MVFDDLVQQSASRTKSSPPLPPVLASSFGAERRRKVSAVLPSTIRSLNDEFRQTFVGGRVVMTDGINALPDVIKAQVLSSVRQFTDFTPDDDPHGEHDFGAFEVDGEKFFWKIDYYDKSLEYGSEDPANPDVTTRVLTIMLASE
jgi:hypothetical protein